MLHLIAVFTVLWSGVASSEILKPWERYSDPRIMSADFERKFSALPLAGQVIDGSRYWSSSYWPLNKGLINFRWNATPPTGFNLHSPSRSEALAMTTGQIAVLSPAEKYDLFIGDYGYGLKNEVARRASPSRADWEGICHGWAAAALNHEEPFPVVVTNSDGIRVPFGSSDLKALLSYYYAYVHRPSSTHQMGLRCSGGRHCDDDLNAGSFHIVLANLVGLEGKSFIVDIENGKEVWNQVVFNFRSIVLRDDLRPSGSSARGTVRVLRLKTHLRVVFNIPQDNWGPVIGSDQQVFKDLEYEYDLDLDQDGVIIGGDWRSKLRPDFLWRVAPARSFSGTLSRLGELL